MNSTFYSSFLKLLKIKRLHYNHYSKMTSEKMMNDINQIFLAAVTSVQPENLIDKAVEVNANYVHIQSKKFEIAKNAYIVGFGKAVLGMARTLEKKLKHHFVTGIISIPNGVLSSSYTNLINKESSRLQVYEGAFNNMPDENSLFAASKISELLKSLKETDLLFVLISGGGSALLPSPKPPMTLNEKIKVIKLLASKGATIEELNTVRKRLSLLKGGGLAKLARPATVISLILSDIIGDPLGLIASGPTVQNTDDPKLPLNLIEKYNLTNEIPQVVLKILQSEAYHELHEDDSYFKRVNNFIIGNNLVALKTASIAAENLNYTSSIMTNSICGIAKTVGVKIISMISAVLQHETLLVTEIFNELRIPLKLLQPFSNNILKLESEGKGLCIILGGETTVEVVGNGIGGRNQELALSAAIELNVEKTKRKIMFLSAGTDGIDGPTDAAGAIVTNNTIELAEMESLNPNNFLDQNNSYTFFSKLNNGKYHVKTGHTGTNVMDVIIILII